MGATVMAAYGTNAQAWVTDTLEMGPGYANDVYYNIATGSKHVVSNSNWDLAFSAIDFGTPHYGVGAWVNEATNDGTKRVALYSLNKSAADYLSITAADTFGKTGTPLHNSSASYSEGAFNANATSPLDYGWGVYTGSGVVVGDSVFLAIKDGAAYKILIKQYYGVAPITWQFYVAPIDGSSQVDTQVIDISADFSNRTFAYYSLDTRSTIDREPDVNSWDFNLTRYAAEISMGPGMSVVYPSTGVLSNPYVKVVEIRDVDADTVNYVHYTGLLEEEIDVIGRDWKTSNFSGNAYILDTVTYFVLSQNQSVHQIEFTYSTISSSGITALRKRTIQGTRVENENVPITTWALAPNPARTDVSMLLDVKENTTARVYITDVSGKVIRNYPLNIQVGMNAFRMDVSNMPSGMYIVNVTNGVWKVSDKLIVQN